MAKGKVMAKIGPMGKKIAAGRKVMKANALPAAIPSKKNGKKTAKK